MCSAAKGRSSMGGTGGSSGTSSTYLEQFVFPVVGGERLQADALRRAWQATLDRFAALRASFDWQSMERHTQLIASGLHLPWSASDYYWHVADEATESKHRQGAGH